MIAIFCNVILFPFGQPLGVELELEIMPQWSLNSRQLAYVMFSFSPLRFPPFLTPAFPLLSHPSVYIASIDSRVAFISRNLPFIFSPHTSIDPFFYIQFEPIQDDFRWTKKTPKSLSILQ